MLLENKAKCLSASPKFIYDEACLDIYNTLSNDVSIYSQYVECNKCEYQLMKNLTAQSSTSLLINTKYAIRMHYTTNNSVLCEWNNELLEHYRYGWNLTEQHCDPLYIKQDADNAYIPILSAFIILMFIGTIWYMVKCIYKCTRNNVIWRRIIVWQQSEFANDLQNPSSMDSPLIIEQPPVKKHPNRIKSIDVFRGFCISMMIFVNYGGGKYWIFQHSVWNGLTIADVVFPWFMWIMGLSFSVSLRGKLRRAMPKKLLFGQILRRSIALFCLGLVLNSHSSVGEEKPLSSLRIFGVLQRLALAYLIAAVIEVAFANRDSIENPRIRFLRDIYVSLPQWFCVGILLAVHTGVTLFVNVPNCGKGYLGPGGLDEGGKFVNCTGGVAGYLDRAVLGDHMYTRGMFKKIYETNQNFDPEGILGILTSTILVHLGIHAGRVLYMYTDVKNKVILWVCYGAFYSLVGATLCGFSKNGGIIPINKHLWSLSFILTLGGTAYLVFAFLFVLVDITRKWGGRPFFYPGMNPLIVYVCHVLFAKTFPFDWIPSDATHAAYLSMNLWGTIIWVSFSIYLYKTNVFLSI